jgi:hypothetical protein
MMAPNFIDIFFFRKLHKKTTACALHAVAPVRCGYA